MPLQSKQEVFDSEENKGKTFTPLEESTLICDQGISNVDKEKSIKKIVFIGQQQQECSGLYKILLANKKQNKKHQIQNRYKIPIYRHQSIYTRSTKRK